MTMKAYKSAPPESFRTLVYKADDGRWYFKDIPENKLRNKFYALGHNLELSNIRTQKVKYTVDGVMSDYLAYRLIYWLETGEWPDHVHIKDKDKPLDFDNLEGVNIDYSEPENEDKQNIHSYETITKGRRFQARLKWSGKNYYLGTYGSLVEAKIAMIKCRQLMFPEQKDDLNKQLVKLVKNVVQGKQL
ncbi:hypothetical protein R3B00_001309 [Klebsiella pneumoniae]|nr:hypothetical protein [Klebsiella pneumoniae]ELQ8980647.1 hypothetical protein [Klebsiella pneumoniae]